MRNSYLIIAISGLLLLGNGCAEGGAPSQSADTPSASIVPNQLNSTKLDLSGGGLDKVPSYVFEKAELRELDLSDNRLTGALPAEIRQLQKLTVLDASRNQMTGVPAEIGQLSMLRVLILSDNKLTGLPLELGNLKGLRRLDLTGNDISPQDLAAIRSQLVNTEILQ